MPERTSTRTFKTEAVQGPDSWISLRAATVGEIMDGMRQREGRDNWRYRLGVFLGRILRRRPSDADLTLQFLRRNIQYVRAWNWVDDLGNPLPSPADDPSVLECLTEDEIALINEAVQGNLQSEEQKN